MFDDYYNGTNVYKEIDKCRSLIGKHEEEVENLNYIIDCLKDSLVRHVRAIELPYSEKMMREAWNQCNKPKSERKMYEFITSDLKERLFEKSEWKDVKFGNILPLNFEHCVYSFHFEYKGKMFELVIPNVKVASKDNISSMWYGMYVLRYEKNKCIWDHITESYDLDDIAKAIQDFVSWTDGEF